MSKGLKALVDIILFLNATEPKGLYCENIEIVKSSLERKEKLEKVWEICKKNIVNLDMICKSESWGYYDGYCAKHYFPRITKEEFNLLKEMLSND